MSSVTRRGGGASFTTIQVPAGTSPVATGPNDTLTLAAGSGITITGDSTTDTVTIAATGGGGTPAGSDKQIQFNDGGAFGADANLVFDKAKDALGVQVAAPLAAMHVAALTGQTIANVTTAAVTQIAETIDASPTGSVDLIAEFGAPGTVTPTQNFSGTGFLAQNQTFDYRITALLFDGVSSYYLGNASNTGSFTDTTGGDVAFSVDVALPTGVTDQTHWLIERQINGGGYNDSVIASSSLSTYEDSGFTGTASTSAWPAQYQGTWTVPSPPSAISGTAIDIGSGTFTANGTTYDIEIRAAANAFGLNWCETTGATGSFTDANDSQTFNLQIDWTPGAADTYIGRITTDSGSTWTYLDFGSGASFTFSGQTNDSVAEAAWSRDVSGINIQYAFKCYGRTISPGTGLEVFASSADSYYATITTPSVKYIFRHNFSGFPSGGGKILADYNVGVANGKTVTSSSFIDVGYSTWGDNTSLTPEHYGFTGTEQVKEYKFYGYSGTLLIYSATAYTISTADTGGYKYNSVTFSFPSGITTVKVTRGLNGAAHSGSRTFTSPTASFLDTLQTSWDGTTTVTPSTATPPATRFDGTRSTESDPDNVQVIALGASGTRLPSISFGVASGVGADASLVARISANSATGQLNIGGGRVAGFTGIAMGTEQWRLGSTYDFNLNAGSATHFTYWSATPSTALAYFYSTGDSARGTVYFGQQTSSFGGSSKVVIAPTAGGTVALHIRRTSGASAAAVLIDEAGALRGEWNSDGRMALGAAAVATNVQLLLGANSGRAQMRFNDGSGGPSSPTAGDLWRNSGQLLFRNLAGNTVTLLGVLTATATLNFPSIAAGATDQLTITVTGAAAGDAVFIGSPSTLNTGLTVTGFVSATNTVTVRVFNGTAGAIDPASSTFRAVVAKL